MAYREKTRYPGVYGRAGSGTRHENDTCYEITYARDGKKVWEKVGWASEGYSAGVASHIRSTRMRSMRHDLELPKDKPKIFPMDAERKHLPSEKADKAKGRFLTAREADRILKALRAKSRHVHDMALLSLHSGMRLSEIARLRMSDIDLANGIITIGDSTEGTPCRAYMTGSVKAMLVSRISPDGRSDDLVFPDEKGRHGESVSKLFLRVADSLQLNREVKDARQRITFSSLRHTFASWLASQGGTMGTVSDLLGQRRRQTTARSSHPIREHRGSAVKRLEDSVSDGRKAAGKSRSR